MMAYPVVRKAVHEVRRHLTEYLRKFGCRPDRVVVELAREARNTGEACARIKSLNDHRRRVREDIRTQHADSLQDMSPRPQARAIDRLLLHQQQRGLCAYSYADGAEQTISASQAISGQGVEIDHIIPRSRGGSDGLHNKVLCLTGANRGKGNRTPREWLDDEAFEALASRFVHWQSDRDPICRRRWGILNAKAPSTEAFIQSQLTDTAYASREVVQWLQQALYPHVRDRRCVYTTNGRYTAQLRRAWGLFYQPEGDAPAAKNRADHRHHAIDAVVVALTGPERIGQIACHWSQCELAQAQGGAGPRLHFETPWGTHDSFRAQVIDAVEGQVVSHRPQRRKLIGRLHRDTHLGPILDADGRPSNRCTVRIPAGNLTPKHLRVPQGWAELARTLSEEIPPSRRRAIRRQMLDLPDAAPGNDGLVRDRWAREELRSSLRNNGLDPDSFTKSQLKRLVGDGKLCAADGVPIRRVTLVRTFNNVAAVPRHMFDEATGRRVPDPSPKAVRLYETQSNHHIEIREDRRGHWRGDVVTAFDAARRVNPPGGSGLASSPPVDRNDDERGRFVMSLSIGEMVRMLAPKQASPDYYVVVKIKSDGRIYFVCHSDAGGSRAREDLPARREVVLSARQLQQARKGPDDGPVKVIVTPLGRVWPRVRD